MFDLWKCLVALVFLVSFVSVHPVEADELSAEDHAEINQLYAGYVQAIDLGDAVGWADAFTPNGSFGDSVTGRDALIAFAERYHEENGSEPRHWYNPGFPICLPQMAPLYTQRRPSAALVHNSIEG